MIMANDKLVKEITARDVDFAKWYTDVCKKAELMDYSDAKGFIIYLPYGYNIWEHIQAFLNGLLKKTGHENVYFPLVIPESLFQKEADHVKGFAPETAIITTGGKEELTERLIVRPTSEVLFCVVTWPFPHIVIFRKSNQWCNVVRWEKPPDRFCVAEFLWQEGHTIHATEAEARGRPSTFSICIINWNRRWRPFALGKRQPKLPVPKNLYHQALMHDNKPQSRTTHILHRFCKL